MRFALLAALGAGGGRHPRDWRQDTPAALLEDVGPAGWQVRLQAAARNLEDAGYRCAAATPEAAAALFGEPLAASVAAIVAGLGKVWPRMTPAGKETKSRMATCRGRLSGQPCFSRRRPRVLPQGSASPESPLLIESHLPKALIEVSGALMVRGCANDDTATLWATLEATFVAKPLAVRRHGVLSSVNAASANRGPEVLGKIVKLFLKAATLGTAGFAPRKAMTCTEAAIALIREVTARETRIRTLEEEQDRNPSEARAAHIAMLKSEVAAPRATRLRLPWTALSILRLPT
ncbi:hypothetical protein [Thermaurantiacus tibetensis]|uniref:hypothetical protein n=1 Tax=Thermaurantiacus tibetensis TaxID=2759035 RepID=UPI00188DDF3A|nr:hypothetical protein [Thermaurantiacus tibetensis]